MATYFLDSRNDLLLLKITGSQELAVADPVSCRCVSALLHLRRLDRFLKHHGLHRTADTLERESLVHFDAAHLQKLVKDGRWSAAWYYLRRFSPLWEPEGEGTNQHYTSLMDSLSDDSMLAFLACRGEEGGRAASSMFPGPSSRALPSDDAFRNKFSDEIKRYDLCHSMTCAQARASVDWENIKLKTLDKIHELLLQRPDFKCSLQMRPTQHMPTLSEIIPLGRWYKMLSPSSISPVRSSDISISASSQTYVDSIYIPDV